MVKRDKDMAGRGREGRGAVLVVDDSAVVRAIVGRYLRNAGYHVDEAEDGTSALRILESGAYDVVITDLRMPGLDGLGVLAAVKERALGAEVIILTGSHAQDVTYAVRALRLGAHDYLTKPPTGPDEVTLTVDRAVEKKRLRDANSRLVRELETLSRTDALTGTLNRRAFDEALRREQSRAQRYGFPMALVLLDIDHFKGINDAHGHPAGDEVLRSFARLTESVFRDTDAVFRYGGEEFAVLLPHTTREGAVDAARRFVAVVADTPVRVGRMIVRLTCSAGVAVIDGSAVGDLVARADAALYEAKETGRNRALAWGEGKPGLRLVR